MLVVILLCNSNDKAKFFCENDDERHLPNHMLIYGFNFEEKMECLLVGLIKLKI